MVIPARRADPMKVVAGIRTFFVTSSILGKRQLLQSGRSARLFLDVLYDYRKQAKFQLHEFVIMPDHFHVLITVNSAMTIEHALQFIKGGFSFRAGRELGMLAPVWQKGFSEVRIRDTRAYEQVRRYIQGNPVKRGLVSDAVQFPYSSSFAGFELDPVPRGLKPVFSLGA